MIVGGASPATSNEAIPVSGYVFISVFQGEAETCQSQEQV